MQNKKKESFLLNFACLINIFWYNDLVGAI